MEAFLRNKGVEQPPSWYIRNIQEFERFGGEKIAIYYEDEILTRPEASARRVSEFLGLDEEKTALFIEDIDEHVARSIGRYTSGGHVSETTEDRNPMHHAKENLTVEQIRDFDRFYFSEYPALASKYLSRYDTRDMDDDELKRASSESADTLGA